MKVRSPLRPGLKEGFQEGHKAAQGVDCHTTCVYREHVCKEGDCVCAPTLCVHVLPGEPLAREERAQTWV